MKTSLHAALKRQQLKDWPVLCSRSLIPAAHSTAERQQDGKPKQCRKPAVAHHSVAGSHLFIGLVHLLATGLNPGALRSLVFWQTLRAMPGLLLAFLCGLSESPRVHPLCSTRPWFLCLHKWMHRLRRKVYNGNPQTWLAALRQHVALPAETPHCNKAGENRPACILPDHRETLPCPALPRRQVTKHRSQAPLFYARSWDGFIALCHGK